jgi:hypothetical protein
MRGAVSYGEVMEMTLTEKQIMADVIIKKIEAESKMASVSMTKRRGPPK